MAKKSKSHQGKGGKPQPSVKASVKCATCPNFLERDLMDKPGALLCKECAKRHTKLCGICTQEFSPPVVFTNAPYCRSCRNHSMTVSAIINPSVADFVDGMNYLVVEGMPELWMKHTAEGTVGKTFAKEAAKLDKKVKIRNVSITRSWVLMEAWGERVALLEKGGLEVDLVEIEYSSFRRAPRDQSAPRWWEPDADVEIMKVDLPGQEGT